MMSVVKGRLLGLGVGPGDPELITLKALRLLRAAPVVGYFVAKGKKGNAFGIIEAHLDQAQVRLPLVYPVTTEKLEPPLCYETIISDFYDTAAEQLAAHLDAGRDVAVICEGDPFFYGSYMYLHDRLATRYESEVVPGVCSMLGGAAVLGAPLVYRNQSLSVLSGVLPEEELRRRLADADAAVVMKLGRNFDKVRRVLVELGLERRALYVERATMANQRIVPLERVEPMASPYFSLIVVPGDKWQGGAGGEWRPAGSGHRHPRPGRAGYRAAGPGALSRGAGPRARRAGRGRPFLYGLRRHPARTVLRRPPDRRPVRRRHRHSQPGAVVATQGSGAAGAGPGRGR